MSIERCLTSLGEAGRLCRQRVASSGRTECEGAFLKQRREETISSGSPYSSQVMDDTRCSVYSPHSYSSDLEDWLNILIPSSILLRALFRDWYPVSHILCFIRPSPLLGTTSIIDMSQTDLVTRLLMSLMGMSTLHWLERAVSEPRIAEIGWRQIHPDDSIGGA